MSMSSETPWPLRTASPVAYTTRPRVSDAWLTSRTTSSPVSAISTFLAASTATPFSGWSSVALLAASPSPHGDAEQVVSSVPAIVVITPVL
jgi:hypothetical protein